MMTGKYYAGLVLNWAARNGKTEIVHALILAKSDMNVQGPDSYTEYVSVKTYLGLQDLDRETTLSTRHYVDNDTALIEAARNNHAAIVQALITAGADLNLQNMEGRTALIEAICFGHSEIALALIRSGANLNLQDSNGFTALNWARNYWLSEIVQILSDAGAKECPRPYRPSGAG